MAASANATIKSTFFHPQHMLASYHYTDASTHTCAACDRVVTGAGYGCLECGFHIHQACFTMPGSVSFANHRRHELALTRLPASRRCDVCREASHAGRYMYLCAPCNYGVHPRCMPPPPPPPANDRDRGGRAALQVVHAGVHVAHTAHNAHNLVSAVLQAAAIGASCTIK
ncbi:unnamed protein product [Urochloa humidicola]